MEIPVDPFEMDNIPVEDYEISKMYSFITIEIVKKIAFRVLTEKQYFAFSLRMRKCLKMEAIGIIFEISPQGASELLKRAYINIRKAFVEYVKVKKCHPAYMCRNPLKSGVKVERKNAMVDSIKKAICKCVKKESKRSEYILVNGTLHCSRCYVPIEKSKADDDAVVEKKVYLGSNG